MNLIRDNLSFLNQFPLYKQKGWSDSLEPEGLPFFEFAFIFGIIVFLFEYYLDIRQLQKFRNAKTLPIELQGNKMLTHEKFVESCAYGKDKYSFGLIESLFMFVEGAALTLLGYLPYTWDLSTKFALSMGLYTDKSDLYSNVEISSPLRREIMITLVFVALLTLHGVIVGLPFSLYSTFVIEEKHGFNKTTLGLFFKDKIIMLGLTAVIGAPVLSIMIWVIRATGANFYFYVWAVLCSISILLMTIYPTFIAPLFNKYTKLEDGEVYDAIAELAVQVKFPLTQIYMVDGSKRSAHSNAYFYGFFKNKRIVLYDTLLNQVTIPEVKAILGHEMGHWKLWHTVQGFFISQLYTLSLFMAFSYVIHTSSMYTSFGFAADSETQAEMPILIGLVLFTQTLWAPIDKILTFLVNCNSRINEFAADEFSMKLGYGNELCSGLIKISVENLGCMVPDKWYSMYHYSHPPLVERLRAIHVDMRGRGEKIAALPRDQGEKTAPEEEAAAEPEQEVKTVKKRGKKMQ